MNDVTVVYDNGIRAVNKASLRVDEGEFVFLVGASGSGKTTIIKLLTAEVRPTEGKVLVNNYNIGEMKKSRIPYLRRTLGVVYQDFRLIKTKTVYENVAFAMRTIGAKSKAIKQRVPYVLDLVGLADKAKEKPMNLSGGEQQRVAIARALVNNPRLIIADEPTGNLDPARSLELMTLFEKINELGTTVLIVTHEKGLVDEFEKRVVMIDHGSVISKLILIQHVFNIVALAMVVGLAVISIFIISNTVKLAMFARREEISIQKMVGATNWFIRWPFVIEGMIIGLVAGGLAFLAEWGLYTELYSVAGGVIPYFEILPFESLRWLVLAVFAGAGALFGIGGSVTSIRKFMDV